MRKAKRRAWIAWSKDEVKLLRELYPSKTARQIAKQIGRSERAIGFGILKLGLQKRLKYEECHRVVNGAKEKLCGKCKTWNGESQFGRSHSIIDGLQWQCKECQSKYARKRYEQIRKGRRRNLRHEDRHRIVKGVKQKFCRKCERWKNETGFGKNRSTRDALNDRCKKCLCEAAGISRKK